MAKKNRHRKPIKHAFQIQIPRIVELSPKEHAAKRKIGKIIPLTLALTAAVAIGIPAAKAIITKGKTISPTPPATETLYRTHITTNLGTERTLNAGDSLLLVVKNNNGFVDPTKCTMAIDENQKGRSPITCTGETTINGKNIAFSYDITDYGNSYMGYTTTPQTHAELAIAIDTKASRPLPKRGNAFVFEKNNG